MKRGRADANVTSKIKPRILFGEDNEDDDEILTCNTTTNCKTIKYNTTSSTTTSLHYRQQQQQKNHKRNSIQFQQDHYSEYSEYDKENCTSFSPLEKKTKTCHSILLCSPPSNSGDRFKTVLKTNATPTRVLDFSDDHQYSLDDDCGHSTSTPKQQQFSEDNQSDHGFVLTPPSSTLSRASSRRISLTPPSTGRLSSGSDSIRRNLDFTLCSTTSFNGPSNLDSSLIMDDPRQHTLLSPFVSQFSISSPKSSMKKNRPTNIQLPKISPSKEEDTDSIGTPLISPLLLTSMDDVFGMEATRKDEEAYRDFSEPSRRLAKDLNEITCSSSSDEEASPLIDANVPLKLNIIAHPKIGGCNSITSKTLLAALRDNDLKNQIRIIDCRFPHEYDGGHIRGALNIWTPDMLLEQFFAQDETNGLQSNQIIVFHCEYSQARAPKMYRHMREYDRKLHLHEYPLLSFPDIYVLEGGYKAFWEEDDENKTFSEPRNYVAMDDQRFATDCKISYQQCKNAWRNHKSKKGAFL